MLAACSSPASKQNDGEKHQQSKPISYVSTEIGWSIKAPEGFKLISEKNMTESTKKGQEAIGEVYNGEVNVDSLKHLFSFQKNQLNMFDSTIEPYDVKKSGSYEKNNQLLKKLVFDTYANQKIKVDTASSIGEIAGEKFNIFEIKVHGPSGEIAMTQLMYSKLYKRYDFGITIIYNNEVDKNLMMGALGKSRFY